MQQMNSENVRKIWERVQQANAPAGEHPDLCGCTVRELNTAAIYAYLSRRIPGKEGKMLQRLAQQERSHAATVKGTCAVTYGSCPPVRITPPEKLSVPVLLRRCYGQKLQAIAEYEKLSSQEGYGSIFRRLAQEEQEQLLFLLQLLGTLDSSTPTLSQR